MPYFVYLAGPIDGMNKIEASNWRKNIAGDFPAYINTLSPLRGRMEGGQEENDFKHKISGFLNTPKAILHRDLCDIERADIILVNLLGAQKVSIGTVSEMAWAYYMKKPCVLVMENQGNFHEHIWIEQFASVRTDDLKRAIQLVIEFLPPR